MAGTSESREYAGAMVAFEGPTDLVSTQLRLLPASPQISILPPVEAYLDADDEDALFDARRHIRRMHNALVARNDAALGFLRDSTPQHKRLVFMNGGAPGATAACVRAIAEHETDGDVHAARSRFDDLVRHGLAGLDRDPRAAAAAAAGQGLAGRGPSDSASSSPDLLELDPSYRAMRAADALDRLTANLQPSTDVDAGARRRPRSMSLPMYSFDDRFGDAAPFYVFGTQAGVAVGDDEQGQEGDDDDGVSSLASAPAVVSPTTNTFFQHNHPHNDLAARLPGHLSSCGALAFPPTSPSCVGEAYAPPTPHTNLVVDMLSPRSELSYHKASEPVVFGRASVVQVRSSGRRRSLKRTRSLDRMFPCSTQYRDTILRMQSRLSMASSTAAAADDGLSPHLCQNESPRADRRRHSCMDAASSSSSHSRGGSVSLKRASFVDEPTRTIYVRTEQPIIALSPAPLRQRRRSSAYVDRGTDAAPGDEAVFAPVLPFWEDLVISFQDATCDSLLEDMVRAFQAGRYPLSPSSPASDADARADEDLSPAQPLSSCATSATTADSSARLGSAPSSTEAPDDYDPFAYVPKQPGGLQIPPAALLTPATLAAPSPPTPAQTPPPTPSNRAASGDKFHVCNVVDCKTAVAVQNDLRYVLNIYFPSEDAGYHHFHFSLLPDMGGMWKPIFRDAEGAAAPDGTDADGGSGSRRIDHILAVGAERGVQRAYVSGITAQLEKLGTRMGEASRSGRLDFRYLVANAMQTFTAQPLSNQTRDNPFTNTYLLATLIIPHLETFFVTNSEVRFLILDYPPDHLPTVLALQRLVGVDLMKVAQVVDSNAKEPLPFTHIRGASITRAAGEDHQGVAAAGSTTPVRSRKTPSPSPSRRPQESVSITQANFLLTTTATEAEVQKFVNTIRRLLVDVSPDYNIAEELLPKRRSSRVPTPLIGTFSAFPRASMLPSSPPLSPSAGPAAGFAPRSPSQQQQQQVSSQVEAQTVQAPTQPRPSSPASSVQTPPSLSDTVKTSRSGRSRRGRTSRKSDTSLVAQEDNTALYIANDDDSDWDLEERRLMPLFLEKPRPRKGNSHKALKFLGLA